MVLLYQPIFKYFDVKEYIMPKLIPSSIYPKGDKHKVLSQETTGELSTAIKGDYGGTFTQLTMDRDGNLMNYQSLALFEQILAELQKMNMHLSMMTDHEITEDDIR